MPDIGFMKKLILWIIVLGAVDLGTRYVVSGKVKTEFESAENVVNDNQFLSSKIISYNRGLFKSNAITEIRFKFLDPSPTILIQHTILQGPIIIDPEGKKPIDFKLAVVHSRPVNDSNTANVENPPTTLTTTTFGFTGDKTLVSEGSGFTIKGNAVEIEAKGWSGQANISKKGTELSGSIEFPNLILQSSGANLELQAATLQFDQHRTEQGIWIGKTNLSFGTVLQKELNVAATKLTFSENSQLHDQVIDIAWTGGFEKADFSNGSYGPLRVQTEIKNIDPEALKRFGSIKADATDEERQDIMKRFLLKKPELIIKNSELTLPEGKMELNADFTVGGSEITTPLDKAEIEKTIMGKVVAVIPKVIAKRILAINIAAELSNNEDFKAMTSEQKLSAINEKVEAKVQELIQQGLLTDKEPNYEIKGTVTQGQLNVVTPPPSSTSTPAVPSPSIAPTTP